MDIPMDVTIPIDLLRSFVAIADTGSFTQAAERVFRTQSAVSQQMKKLEQSVGKPLFERSGRAIRLTREGEAVLSYGRRILSLHDEAVAMIAEPEVNGIVRFGMPDDYVAKFLPPILESCMRLFPRLQIEMTCLPSFQLIPARDAGEIDVAVISIRPGVEAEFLRQEEVLWVTSPRHQTHEMRPLPIALFDASCPCHQAVCTALDRKRQDYRIVYSSPSHAGLVCAVQAGIAVSALTRSAIPVGLRVLGPEDGFALLPPVQLGLLRGNKLSDAAARFADHVTQGLRSGGVLAAA
jgi:DNA-binding transcriptional LysR family regulator